MDHPFKSRARGESSVGRADLRSQLSQETSIRLEGLIRKIL